MNRLRHTWHWAALAAILAGVLVGFRWVSPSEAYYPKCIIHASSGLDCPVCGSSRSVHALASGDIRKALAQNTFITISIPSLLVYSLFMSFAGGEPRRSTNHRKARRRVVLVFLLAWLLYAVARNVV